MLTRARSRPPRGVVLLTALHLTLLATYSFTYPTWTGYDEAQHVDMVYGLLHGGGWPAPGDRIMAKGVAATSDDFDRGRYAGMFQSGRRSPSDPPFAAIRPTPRGRRLSFDALGGPEPVTDGRLPNQIVQHPPMIYVVGAGMLAALPGSSRWAYDRQVWALRLLNISLVAPLPLLAWAAARRFGLCQPLAQAAAAVPLAVPGLTRVGATFNNDGLLMFSVGGLTVLIAGVLAGDMRRRTAVGIALSLTVALLTKALALPLVLMVAIAYPLGWAAPRGPRGRRCALTTGSGRAAVVRTPPWRPALLAIGLACAAGGWWWVRNYILYHSIEPNGWATDPPRREPILLPKSFGTWYGYFWRTIISRFWGGLGMFEPPALSRVATLAATLAVTGCVIAAVTHRRDAGVIRPGRRPTRLGVHVRAPVLLMPVFLAYLLVGQRSYADYLESTRAIAVQGRYLYLGIVGIAVVTAGGLGRLLKGRERLAGLAVLAGALAMQSAALWAVCSYYWLPPGASIPIRHIVGIVAAIGRWAPVPEGVTIATFTLCVLFGCLTLAEAVREVRGDRAGGRRGQAPRDQKVALRTLWPPRHASGRRA
ncbi:hypothetical protein [Frankia sp. Cas4]|uniref:hypothetical protein n=1 Tax=Frankia sp. Cas4 TaxID=3073927 RepID=UPI002AD32BD3|nr:hypothetical protein [Frankia sp. Cas4]